MLGLGDQVEDGEVAPHPLVAGRSGDVGTEAIGAVAAAHERASLVDRAEIVGPEVNARHAERLVERSDVWGDAARAALRARDLTGHVVRARRRGDRGGQAASGRLRA